MIMNPFLLQVANFAILEFYINLELQKKEKEDETDSSRGSLEGSSSDSCVTESASNVVKPYNCDPVRLRSRPLTRNRRGNSVVKKSISPKRNSRLRKSHPKQTRKALKTEHPSGVKKPAKRAKISVNEQTNLLPVENGTKVNLTKEKTTASNLPSNVLPVQSFNRSKHLGQSSRFSGMPILENFDSKKKVDEEIIQVEIAPIPVHKSANKKKGRKKLSEPTKSRDHQKDLMVTNWKNDEHNYAARTEEGKRKFIEEGKKHKEEAEAESIALHMKSTINVNQQSYDQGECHQHSKCGSCCLPITSYFPSGAFPVIRPSEYPECTQIREVETETPTSVLSMQNCTDSHSANLEEKSSSVLGQSRKRTRVLEVLECVENVTDVSVVPVHVSDLSGSSEHTKENAEIGEKERAMEFLSNLQSKKKKKNQGPVQCEICSKTFTAHATLVHHYRGHAKIKLYRCDKCDVTFTRKHSLNYHLSIHDNKCRFKCQACGKPFRHPSHFREHMRRHTGETPFECDICGQRFRTRNSFKRHMKIMHKKKLTNRGLEDIPETSETSQ